MVKSQHVSHIVHSCYVQLRQIRRVGKDLSKKMSMSIESKLMLVHALVYSRLDLYNNVLSCLPCSRMQQLQSVLNSPSNNQNHIDLGII